MPKITVLMAVHNGMPYLPEAVDSILRQTFNDFEFLIIDDASTDGSKTFLLSRQDTRIRLVFNRHHLGLSKSLNKGLDLASAKYVARMDHDDISLPDRLGRQKAFLDANPQIAVLGTWARTFGPQRKQIWRYPIRDSEIRSELVFNSPLVHSSVMLRRSTFNRHHLRYDEKVKRAQDYELWTRAAPSVQFANLPYVLLNYRLHAGQVGRIHGSEQQAVADMVRLREIRKLGITISRKELNLHNGAARWGFPSSRAGLQALERWFLKLCAANKGSRYFEMATLDQTLQRRWWAACRSNVGMGLGAWRLYAGSPLAGGAGHPAAARFWVKALIRELGWRRR
ncbi:MAG: glycosyltransferase [Anaerolineales bacterium]